MRMREGPAENAELLVSNMIRSNPMTDFKAVNSLVFKTILSLKK